MGPFAKVIDGFNGIIVITDRLTKDCYITPISMDMDAQELARLFLRNVWKLYGLPNSIVSDRGSLFVSEFWKLVYSLLLITLSLSTAYYPETDG